jgi:hypothetical protein
MKKVLCCIPTLGTIRIELAQRLYQWKAQYGDFFDVYPSSVRPLFAARNDCVKAFLNSDASYLFLIDSDAVPPLNAIDALLSHGFDKKIVSGLCPELKRDSDGILKKVPMALRKVKNGEYKIIDGNELNGLISVDAAGTICVMIHKSVFKKLHFPWFANLAEDFYFYEKAKASGFDVFVDCDCEVTHYKVVGL